MKTSLQSNTPRKSGTILIVDDEVTFLEATADLLRQEGFECTCASDGPEARQLLEQRRYDLLIADIRMPGNSDLELIRDLPQLAKGMPAILQTGYPSITTAVRSLELSVIAYLIKPVDFDKLLEAVQRAIGFADTIHTVEEARARTADSLRRMTQLEESLGQHRGNSYAQPVQSFVDVTLAGIVGGLEDLKRLTDAGGLSLNSEAEGSFEEREKLDAAKTAISDAVETLDKTRNSFKSKTLGSLRVRLESLLAELS